MKYSLNWLNELISIEEFIKNPSQLSQLLNLKGLEVEEVYEQKWDKIVIGQITRQTRHPEADKLKLCEVKVKADEPPLTIVCGADNQKQGDLVAVCLDGAYLPGGLAIKERKIRGELSQGMLASEEELALKDSSNGILILPSSAPIGKRLDDYLGLRDCFFDLTTAPNRPDLLSYIGLARELSGLLNKPLKLNHLFWLNSYKKEVFEIGVLKNHLQNQKKNCLPPPAFKKIKTSFKVEVKEPEICPLYLGIMIKGVTIGPSPLWLKQRLKFLSLKSINNVVDITQWILLEWGQPLHAFDHDLIEGSLCVRKANSQEKMTALDDSELEFCGDELVISDEKKPLALAGVIGGKSSAISDSTKNIFIESAVFVPYAVRRAARRFKLKTDSAFCFSRGAANPKTTLLALKRACSLIQQTAGGFIHPEIYHCSQNANSQSVQSAVEIEEAILSQRLGYPVSGKEFAQAMERMNCVVKRKGFSKFKLTPPHYRRDLKIKEDFIEEWARLKGYESVREVLPSITPQINKDFGAEQNQLEQIKNLAREQGFYQAVNYSFADSVSEEEFLGPVLAGGQPLSPVILIKNPISQDLNSLRRSLLPGLFKNLVLNIRRGQHWGRVFEQGISFSKQGGVFKESQMLSFILWGQRKTLWRDESARSIFFDLKAFVENVLNRSGFAFFTLPPQTNKTPFFHPKKSRLIKAGSGAVLGSVGVVHPVMAEKNKIRVEAALGEINLSLLFSQPKKKFRFKPLSSKPSAVRDMSLVMGEDCPAGEVLHSMRKLAPSFCQSIAILDCYEDSDLKQNKQKSVTFRWVLQGDEKTLSENQIAKEKQRVLTALTKKWPLQERAGERG